MIYMMTSSNGNIVRVTGVYAENSPVPGEFPAQRPVTRGLDVFFDLRLNKRLSKQSWGWWFETLSRPLWRQFNHLLRYGVQQAREYIYDMMNGMLGNPWFCITKTKVRCRKFFGRMEYSFLLKPLLSCFYQKLSISVPSLLHIVITWTCVSLMHNWRHNRRQYLHSS